MKEDPTEGSEDTDSPDGLDGEGHESCDEEGESGCVCVCAEPLGLERERECEWECERRLGCDVGRTGISKVGKFRIVSALVLKLGCTSSILVLYVCMPQETTKVVTVAA